MHRTFHHSDKRNESGTARTRLLICDKESGSASKRHAEKLTSGSIASDRNRISCNANRKEWLLPGALNLLIFPEQLEDNQEKIPS